MYSFNAWLLFFIQINGFATTDKQNRSFQQIVNRRTVPIDDLPVVLGFFSRLDGAIQIVNATWMEIPVRVFSILVFSNHNRTFSLGQKKQCQSSCDLRIVFHGYTGSAPETGILNSQQMIGAFTIPVITSKEPDSRKSPGTFQARKDSKTWFPRESCLCDTN